jgi:hypothetical protein
MNKYSHRVSRLGLGLCASSGFRVYTDAECTVAGARRCARQLLGAGRLGGIDREYAEVATAQLSHPM